LHTARLPRVHSASAVDMMEAQHIELGCSCHYCHQNWSKSVNIASLTDERCVTIPARRCDVQRQVTEEAQHQQQHPTTDGHTAVSAAAARVLTWSSISPADRRETLCPLPAAGSQTLLLAWQGPAAGGERQAGVTQKADRQGQLTSCTGTTSPHFVHTNCV
jgi:hypothetical protein